MSSFHTLSIFRQITAAVAHLNSLGIIHRDVHPNRIHMLNGIVKFNVIGLPYNFKKLTKQRNYCGHINYSAPEFIMKKKNFCEKVDTWNLGCLLYYLITKRDPFIGKSVIETKKTILYDRINVNEMCANHDPIFS